MPEKSPNQEPINAMPDREYKEPSCSVPIIKQNSLQYSKVVEDCLVNGEFVLAKHYRLIVKVNAHWA